MEEAQEPDLGPPAASPIDAIVAQLGAGRASGHTQKKRRQGHLNGYPAINPAPTQAAWVVAGVPALPAPQLVRMPEDAPPPAETEASPHSSTRSSVTEAVELLTAQQASMLEFIKEQQAKNDAHQAKTDAILEMLVKSQQDMASRVTSSEQLIASMKKDEYAFKRKVAGGAVSLVIASFFGGAYVSSRRRLADTTTAA